MQYWIFSFFSKSDSGGNGVGSNKAKKKTLKEKGTNSKHEEKRK